MTTLVAMSILVNVIGLLINVARAERGDAAINVCFLIIAIVAWTWWKCIPKNEGNEEQ